MDLAFIWLVINWHWEPILSSRSKPNIISEYSALPDFLFCIYGVCNNWWTGLLSSRMCCTHSGSLSTTMTNTWIDTWVSVILIRIDFRYVTLGCSLKTGRVVVMAEASQETKNMELMFYIYGSDYLGGYPLVTDFTDLVGFYYCYSEYHTFCFINQHQYLKVFHQWMIVDQYHNLISYNQMFNYWFNTSEMYFCDSKSKGCVSIVRWPLNRIVGFRIVTIIVLDYSYDGQKCYLHLVGSFGINAIMNCPS